MKYRPLLTAGIVGLLAFVGFAWYLGFVPVFNGPARAGVRHALHLQILPFGLGINDSGMESWTDYIFEADLSISPQSLDSLLAGRTFQKEDPTFQRGHPTDARRIEGYQGFPISEVWSWTHRPEGLREVDFGTQCTVFTNLARDRVFLVYMTD